jgi:hypothetical protein
VDKISREKIEEKCSEADSSDILYLSSLFPSHSNKFSFCKTCSRSIKSGKKPKASITNGLDFPELPECLKGLTPLEERLISPRLPFMIIKSLGYGRQSAIKGAVINVPIPVANVVTSLPRAFNEAEVGQIYLKRKMEYNHNFMAETIRPSKVADAIRYLVNTELYRKHQVTVNEQWLSSYSAETVPFVASADDRDIVSQMLEIAAQANEHNSLEDEVDLNPGGQETFMENVPVENLDIPRIAIAPGEGQRPLDMITDYDSEELAFPTIFAGIKRKCQESFTTIVRSELRNFDRRGCRTDKLFHNFKKLEMISIRNSTSICLRKHSATQGISAADVRNEETLNRLILHDDGYRLLKGIRTSPAHWEDEKKKVMAMIRQVGLPTFFITFSAAETRWPELLVLLCKNVDKLEVSEEEALNLGFNEKARLSRPSDLC